MKTKIKESKELNAIVLTSEKAKLSPDHIKVRNEVCQRYAECKNIRVISNIHCSFNIINDTLTELSPSLLNLFKEYKEMIKYLIIVHEQVFANGFSIFEYKIEGFNKNSIKLKCIDLPKVEIDLEEKRLYESLGLAIQEAILPKYSDVMSKRISLGKKFKKEQQKSNNC